MKNTACAGSEGLLHPSLDRDQGAGAVCTSLLWGCSRLGTVQGNRAAAPLQSGPLLHGQLFQCLLSEGSGCFRLAAHIVACITAKHGGQGLLFERLTFPAHGCCIPVTEPLGSSSREPTSSGHEGSYSACLHGESVWLKEGCGTAACEIY